MSESPPETPAHEPEIARAKQVRAVALLDSLVVWTTISALAVWAIPRHVQGGDSGEMATIMLRGGVPHPSGYPWMRFLGFFARALETIGFPPMIAAALPCALCGVVGLALLHGRLRGLVHPWASAAAVLLLGTAPIVAIHANDAEVFGPLLGFVGAVLFVAFRRPSGAAWGHAMVVGLALGLAVTHHLTAVLLVPLCIGAVWPASGKVREIALVGLAGVGGSLLGLLFFGTLMIGSGGAWRWGDTSTLSGLVHHVTRGDYGVFALSLHEGGPGLGSTTLRAITSIGSTIGGSMTDQKLYAFLVLAAVVGFARRPTALSRPCWWGLWGSIALAGLAFPSIQNIDPSTPFGRFILERFDLLPLFLLGLPLATVFERSVAASHRSSLRVAMVVTYAALLVGHIIGIEDRGRPSASRVVEKYAVDVLSVAPEGSVVFGTDDHRTFPILYAQEVLAVGGRVTYIDASLLAHPWYRERIRERWPDLPVQDKPLRTMAAIWEKWGDDAPPIFLTNIFSKPAAGLPTLPEGPLLRVLRPGEAPPPLPDLTRRVLDAYSRCSVTSTDFVRDRSPWAADLQHAYLDPALALRDQLRTEDFPPLDQELRRILPPLPLPPLPEGSSAPSSPSRR